MTTSVDAAKPSHFLRQAIERDLAAGTYANRPFAGTPGDAAHHAKGPVDAARIRTRFPPEPNGHLHVGHAKSICLNFGLARDYGGVCHLRFDDTNPEKEERAYVEAIEDSVRWLGFDWTEPDPAEPGALRRHLYHASDYFDFMYRAAEALIEAGHAYVDEQSAEEMRASRGDFAHPGTASPQRDRSPAENLARFREMRDGLLPDGAAVLRAKIDMASPNINLRDPALYRIKRATHHNTGDRWCIYPMYTYAHPIEDALEHITHSICTLEFEDQRPFYDWLLDTLCDLGLLAHPRPHQYEFARLNLTYIVTSKRKLRQLVDEGHVDGWDDPRMPTLIGMRRRGYTPESIRLLAERSGVSKSGGWIDYSSLDIALRDDLDPKAPRANAVLDPLALRLVNFAEIFGSDAHREPCHAPRLPHADAQADAKADAQALRRREFALTRELWIERDDFIPVPAKGYFRLYPPQLEGNAGGRVRLKYGYVVECCGYEQDAAGKVTTVLARIVADTKSGTPGAAAVKVKGVITWVGAGDAVEAEFRLYDRLFTQAQPDAGGRDFLSVLNPDSKRSLRGFVEPGLADVAPGERFQFERHGYFIADPIDHRPGHRVFNRTATLKDTWQT